MADISGVNIPSSIAPYTTEDTYASHQALYGKGGIRTVADITARNAIPNARLEKYMLVVCEDTGTIYKLINVPEEGDDLQNSDWEEFSVGVDFEGSKSGYIDPDRTDDYVEDGSINYPYKSFASAVADTGYESYICLSSKVVSSGDFTIPSGMSFFAPFVTLLLTGSNGITISGNSTFIVGTIVAGYQGIHLSGSQKQTIQIINSISVSQDGEIAILDENTHTATVIQIGMLEVANEAIGIQSTGNHNIAIEKLYLNNSESGNTAIPIHMTAGVSNMRILSILKADKECGFPVFVSGTAELNLIVNYCETDDFVLLEDTAICRLLTNSADKRMVVATGATLEVNGNTDFVANTVLSELDTADEHRSEINTLTTNVRKLIIDTDLRNDADDSGALGIAFRAMDMGIAEVLGVGFSTTGLHIVRTCSAIAKYYGRDILIGDAPQRNITGTDRYAPYTSEKFKYDIHESNSIEAIRMYRKLLKESGGGVTFVVLGGQTTFSLLLQSAADYEKDGSINETGLSLVTNNVDEVFIMGGCYNGIQTSEYNILQDIVAANYVAANCPVDIIYHGYEVGYILGVGGDTVDEAIINPVGYSYDVASNGFSGYDPICLWHAIYPDTDLLVLSDECEISYDPSTGEATATPTVDGKRWYIVNYTESFHTDYVNPMLNFRPNYPNKAPVALIDYSVDGLTVELNGLKSKPHESEILQYVWDINGDYSLKGEKLKIEFDSPGLYTIRLIVEDAYGRVGVDRRYIRVFTDSSINSINNEQNLLIPCEANCWAATIYGNARELTDVEDARPWFPKCILYDYAKANYYMLESYYTQYGGQYGQNLPDDLYWYVLLKQPVTANYLSIGGGYSNQDQSGNTWTIELMNEDDEWETLATGTGGWLNASIYEWTGTARLVKGVRLKIDAPGYSGHIRGRGGSTTENNDSAETTKAVVLAYTN